MLFVVAASLAASLVGETQSPATVKAGAVSPDQAKSSATAPANAAKPAAGPRKIPCKTPENASQCYWTHGRLSFYIQHPPLRIWRIGTDRLLGVYSGPSHFPPPSRGELLLPELPANLSRLYDDLKNWEPPDELIDPHVYWGPNVFADFQVCPLEPERHGWMQAVCIESAKNVFLENPPAPR